VTKPLYEKAIRYGINSFAPAFQMGLSITFSELETSENAFLQLMIAPLPILQILTLSILVASARAQNQFQSLPKYKWSFF
jgi:hypothetical protein